MRGAFVSIAQGENVLIKFLNVFEQPWTLLAIGLWLDVAILIGARYRPLKFGRKHLLLGVALVVLAFALDYMVATDCEKINTVITKIVKASEQENAQQIINYIGPDYDGRVQESRQGFAAFARQLFSGPLIEKNYILERKLQLGKNTAVFQITAVSELDKSSQWAAWMPVAKTVWQVRLQKQPDKAWLIVWLDLLELNNEPVDTPSSHLPRNP